MASKTMKLSLLKKKKVEEEEEFVFDDSEDTFDFDDEPTPADTRSITLTMTSTGQLDVGELLKESVQVRNIIPQDWDLEKWSQWIHSVGHVPFYILCGDEDRYHMCIYAAEVLRNASAEVRNSGLKYLPRDNGLDTLGEMEGEMWGENHHRTTVRDHVTMMRNKQIEENKARMQPAPQHDPEDPLIKKWELAHNYARNMPRAEWENQFDWEFECMIKYCYGWLEDIGEVPKYPHELVDVFWSRDTYKQEPQEATDRRNAIVGKILGFWRKQVASSPEGLDITSDSYRTVLAAKALSKSIERYAYDDSNHFEQEVKNKAVEYFNAHFPIAGNVSGPDSTIEPNYVDYMRLCRKYGLEEGTLLHESGIEFKENK